MISERGRIVALVGTSAWVQTDRESTCSRCKLQSGCGQRLFGGMFGRAGNQVLVRLDEPSKICVNDEVEVGIPEAGLLKLASLAYLAPLTGLLLGTIVGQWILAEAGAIFGAIIGLPLAIVVARRLLANGIFNVSEPVLIERVTPGSAVFF